MASNPAFIATPRVGVGLISTAQTARTSGTTSNVVDIISAAASGTRVLEIVLKADGDPADSTVFLWLHNGTTNYIFDEIDIGNPAAGSTTTSSYRTSATYTNLLLPNGWKLQASISVTTTSGSVNVIALGGDL